MLRTLVLRALVIPTLGAGPLRCQRALSTRSLRRCRALSFLTRRFHRTLGSHRATPAKRALALRAAIAARGIAAGPPGVPWAARPRGANRRQVSPRRRLLVLLVRTVGPNRPTRRQEFLLGHGGPSRIENGA